MVLLVLERLLHLLDSGDDVLGLFGQLVLLAISEAKLVVESL